MLSELEIFKEEVRAASPIEVVIGRNVQLSPNGRGLKGRCPFHDDHDPSLSVDPEKQLFYCHGCKEGGDVFSYLMLRDNIAFFESVICRAEEEGIERPNMTGEQREQLQMRRRIEDVLKMATEHFHSALTDEMRERFRVQYGINTDTIDELKLGYSDGNLVQHLLKEGVSADDMLASGLAVKTGRGLVDFFVGRLVFPYWKSGSVVYMIGRQTEHTPDEPWEKGKYKKLKTTDVVQNDSFYNEDAVKGATQICITEGITDCIAAHQVGIACISPATTQFRKEDQARLLHLVRNVNQVYICNDNEKNESGMKGALATADFLEGEGKTVFLVRLPRIDGVDKVDLCDYLKEHSYDDFERLMKQAHTLADVLLEQIDPDVQKQRLPQALRPLFVRLAKSDEAAGLLFINHRVKEHFKLSSRDIEALRKSYNDVLKGVERERVLEVVGEEQVTPLMSEDGKAQALSYLMNSDLLNQICKDVTQAGGIVGEETNVKFMYLAATSRMMQKPINTTVFAQSSSGKSHLVNTVAEFIPSEGKLILSSASTRALEYIDEKALKHRFFVIQELEGAEDVLPTLRVLQSEGKLARLVTIQDPVTHEMIAHVSEKEVPCASVMTTTAGRLYDENSTRIFEIYIDESKLQTGRIVTYNLRSAGLDHLRGKASRESTKSLHHNVQRLLEPIDVVISYSDFLTFPAETTRNRRDSARFIQLIRAVTFLHQKQREVKEEGAVKYIEATVEDYRMAYDIGVDILRRTLDELSDRSRRVLRVIVDFVNSQTHDDVKLTRKKIGDHAEKMGEDFKNTRDLGKHLKQLSDLEYVEVVEGGKGKTYVYKLKFEGDVECPNVKDLLEPDKLEQILSQPVPF
jgi:DNA primase catalytic core